MRHTFIEPQVEQGAAGKLIKVNIT